MERVGYKHHEDRDGIPPSAWSVGHALCQERIHFFEYCVNVVSGVFCLQNEKEIRATLLEARARREEREKLAAARAGTVSRLLEVEDQAINKEMEALVRDRLELDVVLTGVCI